MNINQVCNVHDDLMRDMQRSHSIEMHEHSIHVHQQYHYLFINIHDTAHVESTSPVHLFFFFVGLFVLYYMPATGPARHCTFKAVNTFALTLRTHSTYNSNKAECGALASTDFARVCEFERVQQSRRLRLGIYSTYTYVRMYIKPFANHDLYISFDYLPPVIATF